MRAVHRSGRGLGASWVADASGNVIDCSSVFNWTNSACYILGATGTVLKTTASGQPTSTADCSQFENVVSGACSLGSWAGLNPNLAVGGLGGLLVIGIGAVVAIVVLAKL